MAEKFCLKWNDFHSNIGKSFKSLRHEDDLFDVTLVSDDNSHVSAHKLVLSACSEYFKTIFKKNKHSHPMLCLNGVSSQDLNNILDYIYNGEIHIYQDNLNRFLDVAERFKLEGLMTGDQTLKDEDILNYPEVNSPFKSKEFESKLNQTNNLKSETNVKTNAYNVKTREIALISGDFSSIEELNQRIEEEIILEGPGLYKCARCLKTYNKRFNLKEHIEVHFEGLSFPCQLCGKDFRSRNNLRRHQAKCQN